MMRVDNGCDGCDDEEELEEDSGSCIGDGPNVLHSFVQDGESRSTGSSFLVTT